MYFRRYANLGLPAWLNLTRWSEPMDRAQGVALRKAIMLLVCFCSFLIVGQDKIHAQTTINREYQIKAAYLFNFGRYTHWPEDTWKSKEDPFVIGVLGPNPFGSSLNRIAAEKKLQDRKIEVRYFNNISEYTPCQILYISESVPEQDQRAIVQKLANSNVLLVGEQYTFLQDGGMVSFLIEANKVRFGVNLDVLDRNHLKISSKVLKLAAIVKQDDKVQ